MHRLRHVARRLALPLLLLLPGLGGAWLQLVHPCPQRHGAGTAAHAPAADPHAHHGDHHGAPAPDGQGGEHERCTCMATCGQAATTVVPPTPGALDVAERAIEPALPAVPEWLPVFTPLDFLPLATAPPAMA